MGNKKIVRKGTISFVIVIHMSVKLCIQYFWGDSVYDIFGETLFTIFLGRLCVQYF